MALDFGAGENPREVWSAQAVPPLEVTLTGPLTVTLGITTTYEISTTGGQIPFEYLWSHPDCLGEICEVLWDKIGHQEISVVVEDFWGAWDSAIFTTEVIAEIPPEPEVYNIFFPLVQKPEVPCRIPNKTEFAFAGKTQSVFSSGCFELGGIVSILEVETTMWFATNGRQGDFGWVNAIGGGNFYSFDWQGFLVCFGESEEQARSLLVSADPNAAPNASWNPEPICVPE